MSRNVVGRLVAEGPTLLAIILFAGCYLRIRQRWFIPGYSGFGYVTWVVQSTVDGTAIAPNQYRLLMPWVDVLIGRAIGVSLPTGILLSDLVLLVVVVLLLRRLAVRSGNPHLTLAGAATWTYWVAKLDQWHPEIMLLTAVSLAAALLLLDSATHVGALLGLGLLACATRTDYAAGLGVTVLGVSLVRRRIALAAVGSVLVAASFVATTAFVAFFPRARYDVDLIQLPYNVTPGALVLALAFYGPFVLLPFVAAAWVRRNLVLLVGPVWFVFQFAFVFIAGRIDESRIFMPLAPVVGVAAGAAWMSLRARNATPATEVRVLLTPDSASGPSVVGAREP